MYSAFLVAFICTQLSIFSTAELPESRRGSLFSSALSTNATGAIVGHVYEYSIEGTDVRLAINASPDRHELPDREVLMCIIQGMGELENADPGMPIENNRLVFDYTWIQIVLEDKGAPQGRFLNDVASWTLRGIAEWMTKIDHFRELTVLVYNDRYFYGVAEVSFTRPPEA